MKTRRRGIILGSIVLADAAPLAVRPLRAGLRAELAARLLRNKPLAIEEALSRSSDEVRGTFPRREQP